MTEGNILISQSHSLRKILQSWPNVTFEPERTKYGQTLVCNYFSVLQQYFKVGVTGDIFLDEAQR